MLDKNIINVAYEILRNAKPAKKGSKREGKHVLSTVELWKEVAKKLSFNPQQEKEFIGDFYLALIQDNHFVYLDYDKDDEIGVWGLKEEYAFDEFNKFQNPWWGKSQGKKYVEVDNADGEEKEVDEEEFEEKSIKENKDQKLDADETDKEVQEEDEEQLGLHETDSLISDEVTKTGAED